MIVVGLLQKQNKKNSVPTYKNKNIISQICTRMIDSNCSNNLDRLIGAKLLHSNSSPVITLGCLSNVKLLSCEPILSCKFNDVTEFNNIANF